MGCSGARTRTVRCTSPRATTAASNKFWYPAPENQYARFIWNGYRNLASFVTTPGGTGSRWLTDAEKTAALSAAGAPATP